jgi:protoheme IX farnesyltransferase
MLADRSYALSIPSLSNALKDLALLFKVRLTFLVVFSSVLGALMPMSGIAWGTLAVLTLSGVLVTGASNAFNQVLEREHDAKMSRTSDRPVATGRLSVPSAWVIATISGSTGIFLLSFFTNIYAGVLALMALLSYAFIYTPLKRVTPWAVLVGAFPGAIPPMLGWVAVTGDFGPGPGALFAVQFMWQFPHFWTIAWVANEDYKKAGFRLLPTREGPGKADAFLILLYSLFLIPAGMLPWAFDITGMGSAIFASVLGGLCLIPAFKLYRTCDRKDAKRLMFASFAYLPLVQIAYVIDKL